MIKEKEEDKVEAQEIVELVEGETTRTTRIGTTLSPKMSTRLIQFLKENRDSSDEVTMTCQVYPQRSSNIG